MDRGAATALRRWAPQCGCSLVGKSCMGEAGAGHRLRPRWTCHLGSRVWRASGVIGRGAVAPRNLCVKEGASGGERVKGGAEPPRCEWRGWGGWPSGLGRGLGRHAPSRCPDGIRLPSAPREPGGNATGRPQPGGCLLQGRAVASRSGKARARAAQRALRVASELGCGGAGGPAESAWMRRGGPTVLLELARSCAREVGAGEVGAVHSPEHALGRPCPSIDQPKPRPGPASSAPRLLTPPSGCGPCLAWAVRCGAGL